MTTVFRLPDLGEGLTEAEILDWRVSVGDVVGIDQIVVEVETAKAAVEVPIPYAGTVAKLYGEPRSVIAVGAPLISVTPVGAPPIPPTPAGPPPASAATVSAAPSDAPPNSVGTADTRPISVSTADTPPTSASTADTSPVSASTADTRPTSASTADTSPTSASTADTRPTSASTADTSPVSASTADAPPTSASTAGERHREEERAGSGNVLIGYGTGAAPRRRRRAVPAARLAPPVGESTGVPRVLSPLVRRLADTHAIDLRSLKPTGPGDVILRRDVEAAIAASTATPDGVVRIPLQGLRRAVADKLARSRREIPDATTWVDVDATALVQLRKELAESFPQAGIGFLALLARICVAGLRRFPQLNSRVDLDRAEILQFPHVHLGYAAQTDRGLVVPVVHDAHRLTLAELAARLRERTEQARQGKLTPQHLTGGTFTLNNYGVFGVDGSTPIINHPEAALLGVGRIIDRPWAVDGEIRLRKITQLSLTFDHRVCDGGTAGGFLRFVADRVERPQTLIADL